MACNFEVRYFSYGPKCKNAKNGQNWAFLVKKHAVYTRFWKYLPILWPVCFLVDLIHKNKMKKIIINIHFLQFFFQRLKLKWLINNSKTPNCLTKSGSNDQRPYTNSYFLEKSSLFDVDLFSRNFHVEMPYMRKLCKQDNKPMWKEN